MHRPASRRRALAAVTLLAAVLAAPGAARAFHLEESLRGSTSMGHPSGGMFAADGWHVTNRTDRIWWSVPTSSAGSIEFTMSNVTNATLFADPTEMAGDNDIFMLYDDDGSGEPIAYRPDFVENNYKLWVRIRNEPGQWGTQKLTFALCPDGTSNRSNPCPCGDGFIEEATGGNPTWDGTPQRLRVEWGRGVARFLRNGVEVDRIDYSATGYGFGPRDMHFSIGSTRALAVGYSGMPVGAVFSDLVVDTTDGPIVYCPARPPADAGVPPPPDASGGCDPAHAITAVSLAPTNGSGASQVFHAVYGNCYGASAFRVVQINVWDRVAGGIPTVGGGFEAGMLYNSAGECAPGEARLLRDTWGGIDCARSRVVASGNQVAVDWALFFASSFVGTHGVWFDAKGGPGTPEPRLGWTQMGMFTVEPAPPDAGVASDAGVATDAGASGDAGGPGALDAARADGARADAGRAPVVVSGDCGCRTAGGTGTRGDGAALALALGAIAAGAARRRERART